MKRYGKYGRKASRKVKRFEIQKKSRLNSEMIRKIQKKSKLNSQKTWKLWKNSRLNSEMMWKIKKKIVK